MIKSIEETIAAQATPAGEGGIAIIRISGDLTEQVLNRIFKSKTGEKLKNRVMTFGKIKFKGEEVDEVMSVFMKGPYTYTRQDVGEIHCHGSQFIVGRILQILIQNGIRIAQPGEFTYRAFVNGRVDLTQAEAVMRLIQANNEKARKSAVRQINGGISGFINKIKDKIIDLSALISANIDFPDEIEEETTRESLLSGCDALQKEIKAACNEKTGKIEEDGVYVSLYGRPNAGKSSLLNNLIGEDRAIVTDIPGTTRDIITATVMIDGVRFTFTDTAGLRETEDKVEKIGVERALRAVREADIKIYVIDGSEQITEEDVKLIKQTDPNLIVLTKEDLPWKNKKEEVITIADYIPVLTVSVKEGEGTENLRKTIRNMIADDLSESCVLSQNRHIQCAMDAYNCLEDAKNAINNELPLDIVNIDLMEAIRHLGEITGSDASEEVINTVFSRFCVGK